MIRALLAKQICSIPIVTLLVERLKNDLLFACDCGFSTSQSFPSSATFSRFYQKVSESEALQPLFDSLMEMALTEGLIDGNVVAIDASAIDAYEKTVPKKELTDNGNQANWGAKLDTHGNQHT